ncbi:hypothetical protein QWZ10_17230 [Paracoccus cavernae]|uniref:Porin n=1 Tax=Paracoccus cavernae TaxID=1571207 RepID=A0ABT8D9P6_9RHOB|nr:hypothetical protein [Paracoccus cavernae]
MKRVITIGAAAALGLGAATATAFAQSSSSMSPASSPFSGLFGGKRGNEGSPVDLHFKVSGDEDLDR